MNACWYVRFIDEEGYTDYVSNRKASCAKEAIRLAKQWLIETGYKTAEKISRCSSWEAERETEE